MKTITAKELALYEIDRHPQRTWALHNLMELGVVKEGYRLEDGSVVGDQPDNDEFEYSYMLDEDSEDLETKIPVIPDLNTKTKEAIEQAPALFYMGDWHCSAYDPKTGNQLDAPDWMEQMDTAIQKGLQLPDPLSCGTAHCRAGWAIVLGKKEGFKLEHETSSETAGFLIYAASCPWMDYPPEFYGENDKAKVRIDSDAIEEVRHRAD
jgi:hypothetical protein